MWIHSDSFLVEGINWKLCVAFICNQSITFSSSYQHAKLKVSAPSSLTAWQVSFSSHHLSAPCVDVVFQVTQAVVRRHDPCQPAVQGQVRRLVCHQEQQTLGLWPPTHRFLKTGSEQTGQSVKTLETKQSMKSNHAVLCWC